MSRWIAPLSAFLIIGSYFLPLHANAGVFSFLFGDSALASSRKTVNSQNMPLLEAVTASNPSSAIGGGDIVIVDGTSLLPETGPEGTLLDIQDQKPVPTQISTYVVRKGDTLSAIAHMFGVSVNTIVWANNLGSKKVISENQILIILPISGIQHVVAKGDTLASIAKKYKADLQEILQYNNIADGTALSVGDTIMVPDAEIATPVSAPSSPSRSRGSSGNPYRGGSGPLYLGYYARPITAAHRTQGLHGFNGVDLGASVGTPILAAASGDVMVAKDGGWNGGYGSYVVIGHANGTQTLYAHASRVLVVPGQHVEQGEEIAEVGSTGHSTGPHLHFEVRGAINPCADAGDACSTY